MNDETVASFSRRRFAQLLGAGAAGAALGKMAAAAQQQPSTARSSAGPASSRLHLVQGGMPAEVVRLSANENPHGPSPAALDAMREAFALAWRYPDEHVDALVADLASAHGVAAGQVLLGDGSSEILKLCAAAATGPGRAVVVADPTFEAVLHFAQTAGAKELKVPLTPDFRHDLPKMLASASGLANVAPGLFYVCNPNNPTGSITPKQEMRAFLARVPGDSLVLVDEAYFHYAESGDYESVVPLIAEHPNLIVARTFSKIYGLAGLRCGYAVARAELIERLRAQQPWDSVNIMALAAARASLHDAGHVESGRRANREVKALVCGELDRLGFRYIPSQANFLMIDLRRQVKPVVASLHQRRVDVGRVFPALPNHLRVTLGTAEQMQSFLAAFRQVAAA
jgi:histidinol-phosphate aminotransferase